MLNNSKSFISVKKSIKAKWYQVIIVFILILTVSIINTLNPIILKNIIDIAIPQKDLKYLCILVFLTFIIPMISVVLQSIKNYVASLIGDEITRRLRKDIFSHLLKAEYGEVQKLGPSKIVYRLTREVGKIGEKYIVGDLLTFSSEIFIFAFLLVVMFQIDSKLTFVCCIAFPVALMICSVVAQKSSEIDRQLLGNIEQGQSYLDEVFNLFKMVKVKNGCAREEATFTSWLDEHRELRIKSATAHNLNRFLMSDIINNSMYALILLIGGVQVIKGETQVGTLVAFIAYIPRLYNSIRSILNIKVSSKVINNTIQLLDEMLEIKLEEQAKTLVNLPIWSIQFKNVSFNYEREGFALKNISFELKAGESLGVIGLSGGGKSTLFDLITKLYSNYEGEILINDIEISNYSIESLRSYMSILPQDITFFNNTILYNMCYPQKDVDEGFKGIFEEIGMTNFTEKLPKGLETSVGNKGEELSAGERQRLLLATIIKYPKPIILLDEATSALDVINEEKAMKLIYTKCKESMKIIIAHRIYTLKDVDKILVISDGNIVEYGEREHLINNKNSLFYKMLNKIIDPRLFKPF